jgi:hypothetical protein
MIDQNGENRHSSEAVNLRAITMDVLLGQFLTP